jgi:hypothetical protein
MENIAYIGEWEAKKMAGSFGAEIRGQTCL